MTELARLRFKHREDIMLNRRAGAAPVAQEIGSVAVPASGNFDARLEASEQAVNDFNSFITSNGMGRALEVMRAAQHVEAERELAARAAASASLQPTTAF